MLTQCSTINLGYESAWYELKEKDELLRQLHNGDLIEFERGIYHHWGVYAGNWFAESGSPEPHIFHAGSNNFYSGNVFFGSKSLNKKKHGMGAVSADPLEDVWAGSRARINNSLDDEYLPFDCSEILIRAEIRVKYQEEYSLITNNCEHFASWCRNGIATSLQSRVTLTSGLTYALTFSCIGLAGLIVSFLKFKNSMEDDFIFSDGVIDGGEEEEKRKKKIQRQMSIELD